jgi:hypothetical protein
MFKSTTFIAFRGLFLGALFAQLEAAYEKGTLDLSAKALVHMGIGSAIAAGFSLWHLYLPSPVVPQSAASIQEPTKPVEQSTTK